MMLYISAAATTNKVLNIFENRFFFLNIFNIGIHHPKLATQNIKKEIVLIRAERNGISLHGIFLYC